MVEWRVFSITLVLYLLAAGLQPEENKSWHDTVITTLSHGRYSNTDDPGPLMNRIQGDKSYNYYANIIKHSVLSEGPSEGWSL